MDCELRLAMVKDHRIVSNSITPVSRASFQRNLTRGTSQRRIIPAELRSISL